MDITDDALPESTCRVSHSWNRMMNAGLGIKIKKEANIWGRPHRLIYEMRKRKYNYFKHISLMLGNL
jgi:hypothetical protein